MAGNCVLTAAGFGSRSVTCETISYGIDIVAGPPDSARNSRTFYVSKVTKNQFALGLTFSKHDDYEGFMRWLEDYGRQAQTPGTPVGAMRATIPARDFDHVGVPTLGMTFGQSVRDVVWRVDLLFNGGRDLNDTSSPASSFINAQDPNSAYFYPAGTQSNSKALNVEDQLYDSQQDDPLQVFQRDGLRFS